MIETLLMGGIMGFDIKKIQRFEKQNTGFSIDPVDPNKTAIFIDDNRAVYSADFIIYRLSSESFVEVEREKNDSTYLIEISVIEFSGNIRVLRGSGLMPSSSGSNLTKIDSIGATVDPTRCLTMIQGRRTGTGSSGSHEAPGLARIISPDEIEITRHSSIGEASYHWQVIEFL